MDTELSTKLIVDPDQREGVVGTVEEGDVPVRLLDGYISEKKIKCCFCRHHQSHYRGYFVELSSGALALAGHCCALKIGGHDSVRKISKSIDRKKKTADLVAERDSLAKSIEDLARFVENELEPFQTRLVDILMDSDGADSAYAVKHCSDLASLVRTLDLSKVECLSDYYNKKDYLLQKWAVWMSQVERVEDLLLATFADLPSEAKNFAPPKRTARKFR